MSKIIALALKDLRLMPRNRAGMFFTSPVFGSYIEPIGWLSF